MLLVLIAVAQGPGDLGMRGSCNVKIDFLSWEGRF